jgi:hypothetical protein
MGTRSAIGYKTPEGKIRAKYSHYDGYPSYTGAILEKHFQEARKIAQMVELGDQSGIAPNVFPTNDTHSFSTPQADVIVFYGRDRGEQDVGAQDFDNVADFVEYYNDCGCEYFYLHTPGGWIVNDHSKLDANTGYPAFDFVDFVLETEEA